MPRQPISRAARNRLTILGGYVGSFAPRSPGLSHRRARVAAAAGAVSHAAGARRRGPGACHLRPPLGGQPVVEQLPRTDHPPEAAPGGARRGARARRRLGGGAHHLGHDGDARRAGAAAGGVQTGRGRGRLPERFCRQCRHGVGGADQGRRHHLGRAEPRQHHRRRPVEPGGDQGVPAQGHRRCPDDPARAAAGAAQAAHHRRRVLDGRRPRAAARPVRPGRRVRLPHDGRRRPRQRRLRPAGSRHRRSLRLPRPRRHPGGHAVEGDWRPRRLRRRLARSHHLPAPPRPAVPVLDLASAGGDRRLPRRPRRARDRAAVDGAAVGQRALPQGRACRAWGSTPA